jgi:hypothetical protein
MPGKQEEPATHYMRKEVARKDPDTEKGQKLDTLFAKSGGKQKKKGPVSAMRRVWNADNYINVLLNRLYELKTNAQTAQRQALMADLTVERMALEEELKREVNGQVKELAERLLKVENARTDLEGTVADLTVERTALEEELKHMENARTALEEELRREKVERTALEETLEINVEELRRQIASEEELRHMENARTALEETLEIKVEGLRLHREATEQALHNLSEDLKALQTRYNKLQNIVGKQAEDLEASNNREGEMKMERNDMQNKLDDLKSALQHSHKAHDKLLSSVRMVNDELESTKEEFGDELELSGKEVQLHAIDAAMRSNLDEFMKEAKVTTQDKTVQYSSIIQQPQDTLQDTPKDRGKHKIKADILLRGSDIKNEEGKTEGARVFKLLSGDRDMASVSVLSLNSGLSSTALQIHASTLLGMIQQTSPIIKGDTECTFSVFCATDRKVKVEDKPQASKERNLQHAEEAVEEQVIFRQLDKKSYSKEAQNHCPDIIISKKDYDNIIKSLRKEDLSEKRSEHSIVSGSQEQSSSADDGSRLDTIPEEVEIEEFSEAPAIAIVVANPDGLVMSAKYLSMQELARIKDQVFVEQLHTAAILGVTASKQKASTAQIENLRQIFQSLPENDEAFQGSSKYDDHYSKMPDEINGVMGVDGVVTLNHNDSYKAQHRVMTNDTIRRNVDDARKPRLKTPETVNWKEVKEKGRRQVTENPRISDYDPDNRGVRIFPKYDEGGKTPTMFIAHADDRDMSSKERFERYERENELEVEAKTLGYGGGSLHKIREEHVKEHVKIAELSARLLQDRIKNSIPSDPDSIQTTTPIKATEERSKTQPIIVQNPEMRAVMVEKKTPSKIQRAVMVEKTLPKTAVEKNHDTIAQQAKAQQAKAQQAKAAIILSVGVLQACSIRLGLTLAAANEIGAFFGFMKKFGGYVAYVCSLTVLLPFLAIASYFSEGSKFTVAEIERSGVEGLEDKIGEAIRRTQGTGQDSSSSPSTMQEEVSGEAGVERSTSQEPREIGRIQ